VTVIGTEAPHSIIAITDADDPNTVERLLASLAAGFANVTTNNAILGGGQAALALNPDHAAVLGAAGHDRRDCRTGDRASNPDASVCDRRTRQESAVLRES